MDFSLYINIFWVISGDLILFSTQDPNTIRRTWKRCGPIEAPQVTPVGDCSGANKNMDIAKWQYCKRKHAHDVWTANEKRLLPYPDPLILAIQTDASRYSFTTTQTNTYILVILQVQNRDSVCVSEYNGSLTTSSCNVYATHQTGSTRITA